MPKAAGLFLAAFAYTLLSMGFVLMKKGIAWIGHRGPRDGIWSRHLITWIAGFLLSNLFIIPSAMALKTLEPHIVAAMAGWGVIVLVLLSRAVLGEKLFRSDAAYTAAIVLAIVLLNLYERSQPGNSVKTSLLAGASFLPFLLILAAFFKTISARTRAVLFAAASGVSAGMIVVVMKILVGLHGYRVAAYFGSPYFYLYALFSLTAFLAMQLAYKLETMMRTGPVQYGLSIIYPAVCSFLVFGNRILPVQVAAIAVLVLSTAGILRKH